MSKYFKTTTFGLLAASLIFSQAAFADGNGQGNAKGKAKSEATATADTTTDTETADTTTETETTTTTETSVEVTNLTQKLEKIEAKFQQFVDQEGNVQAQTGKLGSIENRVEALKELADIEKEIEDLEGTEEEAAVDSLVKLYADLGEFEKALEAQQKYVAELDDSSDEVLLEEYKEIGKLLKKMGKVGVKALVNGEEPQMDVSPMIENGRTLVPFRPLAESLDAEVKWDAEKQTVTVTTEDAVVVLTINKMIATVDGVEVKLDVPAKIVKGRTVVPLRFLSQALKAKVLWEQENQLAIVIKEKKKSAKTESTEETSADTNVDATVEANTDATVEDTTVEASTETTVEANVTTTTN